MENFFFNKIAILFVLLLGVANMQAEEPEIIITSIPRLGTNGSAEGKVIWSELSASNFEEYAVIAILQTSWDDYVKPYDDNFRYLNAIDECGNFLIYITSNPNDYTVDSFIFYLVLRETFDDGNGSTIKTWNMADKYLGQPLTISRQAFWENRPLPPIANLSPGFVAAGSNITLSCQSGETIHYTTDGSDPTSSSSAQIYSMGTTFTVPVNGSLLVKAATELSGLYSTTASFLWLPQEPLTTPFWGLNVSLALNGEAFGYPLSEEITRTRMQPIAQLTKWVRTFGTINNGLPYINKIAKNELGLHTMIGIYITNNAAENDAQIQGLRQILDMNPAPDLIAVGNECSIHGICRTTLASYIDSVRKELNERSLAIPVGSVDIDAPWAPSVLDRLDFIGVNIYPGTWDDTPENQMLEKLEQKYAIALASFPSKLVLLTETGTPYAGDPYIPDGASQTQTPSNSKAVSYLDGFMAYAKNESIPAFYFEAYDEPAKSQNGGHQIEQYLGLMDGNKQIHSFYQGIINKYITSTITPDIATDITLYPNPVSDNITIKGLPVGATITIIDATGKIVKIVENASGTINVSHLPKGTYFVNVNEKILKLIKR